jgi:hypothetical protein
MMSASTKTPAEQATHTSSWDRRRGDRSLARMTKATISELHGAT